MTYTPPSIDSYGGILEYLDATKHKHKGYGSKDLVKNWNNGTGKHMNTSALAILFGVSRPTMVDWIERLKRETIAKQAKIADNTK